MALSKEEILDAISEMSVIDIVDLISAMEEKFGVSAAAPVAAAAPAAGGGDSGAEEAADDAPVDIHLTDVGDKKVGYRYAAQRDHRYRAIKQRVTVQRGQHPENQ